MGVRSVDGRATADVPIEDPRPQNCRTVELIIRFQIACVFPLRHPGYWSNLLGNSRVGDAARKFVRQLIHIAPTPRLAGFQRLDDGVFGSMKMLGRMLVLRRIAATD